MIILHSLVEKGYNIISTMLKHWLSFVTCYFYNSVYLNIYELTSNHILISLAF